MRMKILLAFLGIIILAAILITNVFSQEPQSDLIVGDAVGISGQTVTLDLVLNSKKTEIRSFQINLSFDGTTLPEAIASVGEAVPEGWSFSSNLAAPGDLRMVMFDPSGTGALISGSVAKISFPIPDESIVQDVLIGVALAEIFDADNNAVTVDVITGMVRIAQPIMGNTVVVLGLPPEVVTLDVTPASIKEAVGTTHQLTAIASFTDGSQRDVTSEVTWFSLDETVVTVTSSGLVTITGEGTSSIESEISPVP